MSWARRSFPNGVIAIFDEPNRTGDVLDFDAPRNAPAKFPADYLDKLYFHSAIDLFEVLAAQTVSINHPAVTAGGAISGAEANTIFRWGGEDADHLLIDLAAYDLEREPMVLAAVGSNIVWGGMPVQAETDGRARYVTVYSTSTEVRLFETASRTSNALPAVSIDYEVLVLAPRRDGIGNDLRSFDPSTGDYRMGFDRFSSLRRFLQVAPGGSPFGLALGRTIDRNNGAKRCWRPDGTSYDPVPPYRVRVTPGTGAYGSLLTYGGSFTGSEAVEVQAP